MVIILTKNHAIISFILITALSFVMLSQSNITQDHILNPLGLSIKMLAPEGLGLNLLPFILFLLIFPLSWSILCLYSLSTKDLDYTILLAPALLTPLIIFFLGISLASLLISTGFIISAFLAHYISYQDKEHYKKISVSGITKNSTAKSLFTLNLVIAIALYLLLITSPQDPKDRLESDLGAAMGNIMPQMLQDHVLDDQKQQAYLFLEHMENTLLNSMESGMSDLTKEESDLCAGALRKDMTKIDTTAKLAVDEQFEAQLNATLSSGLLPKPMIEQYSKYYPLLIVFSLFATLEILRIMFFVHLAAIYAWLLSKFIYISSESQSSNKTAELKKAVLNQNNPCAPNSTASMSQNTANSTPRTSNSDTSHNSNPYYSADESELPQRKTDAY